MRKPSVFVLGVQKCGTTTIADILDIQPELFMPAIKETYFFCDEEIYARGASHWLEDHYLRSDANLLCDATPFHLASERALERIAEFADDEARFIVALRDPVARAYSAYWHQLRDGNENLSFEEALQQENVRISKARAMNGRWWRHAYVQVGKYGEQLDRAFSLLGRERFLVLNELDLADTNALQTKLRTHLGLSSLAPPPELVKSNQAGMPRSRLLHSFIIRDNPAKSFIQKVVPREIRTRVGRLLMSKNLKTAPYPSMPEKIRRQLYTEFESDISRLASMNVCDVSHWQSRHAQSID